MNKNKKTEEEEIEDLAQIRNIQERLANVKLGNAFGLTTREGIKIFKLIEIRPHPVKKDTK